MECPHCQTDNREDRETCYVCGKDISTIRLVVNKARQHYNDALEHAERGRVTEAIDELKHAIDLDAALVNAHVVLGTLYARQGHFLEARIHWKNALALRPELERAHDYLERVESVQAVLPTLKTYRWAAVALLLATVALAATLIYVLRPEPGADALRAANRLVEQNNYIAALDQLEQARVLSEFGSPVSVSATALEHTIRFDLQQQIRLIQDLKYRQMFPEALEAMAALEASGPDVVTSAALSAIRSDISYYYYNLIAQLYASYEQGDLEFEVLQDEITRYINLYPGSPDRDEILSYLERAERLEVQTAMDELRRRFVLDNNIDIAIEGLRELTPRFSDIAAFREERTLFIEEVLDYQFNLFARYLGEEEFVRAAQLLRSIERITTEFRGTIEDISGAVDLAWSVLRDARRQSQLEQIESLIAQDQLLAAEEAVFDMLQERDLSEAELGVLDSYWRRINRRERLEEFYSEKESDSRYFDLRISDEQASRTLRLLEDTEGMRMPRRQRVHLLGLAAASALKLGGEDRATSLSATLQDLDEASTVTRAVRRMIREASEVGQKAKEEEITEKDAGTTAAPVAEEIRIEPAGQPREKDQ